MDNWQTIIDAVNCDGRSETEKQVLHQAFVSVWSAEVKSGQLTDPQMTELELSLGDKTCR